jgi:hypothetical protein
MLRKATTRHQDRRVVFQPLRNLIACNLLTSGFTRVSLTVSYHSVFALLLDTLNFTSSCFLEQVYSKYRQW